MLPKNQHSIITKELNEKYSHLDYRDADKTTMNFRVSKELKEEFLRICEESDTTPSLVIRRMMKNFCITYHELIEKEQ